MPQDRPITGMEAGDNLLANQNVRIAVGLMGSVTILVVAFLFIEPGPVRWALVAMAVIDAIGTPYILGLAVEHDEEEQTQSW